MSISVPAAVESASAEAAPGGAPACPSCAVVFVGEYCHRCGEHNPALEDRSLRHFFREAASDVANLDSRVVRTARALLFQPGFLTLEYLSGRRKPYVGPLKTFVVVFAVTLFAAFLLEGIVVPGSAAQGGDGTLEPLVEQVVGSVARHQGVSVDVAERQLLDAIHDRLSWFAVLVPLLFGGVVHAVFRRHRRWFTENLVFATHFAAFHYMVVLLLLPLQLSSLTLGAGAAVVLSLLLFVVMTAYLVAAVRRVYPGARWGGIPGALALQLGFSLCQTAVSLLAICSAVLALRYL